MQLTKNISWKSSRLNNGFTLLEVLVSLVIIAIGLLGMVGLQVTTMKNNNNSGMRTQAMFLAEDLAERMRANETINYANVSAGCDSCISSGCGNTALAANDLCEWQTLVSALPSGTGQVTSLGNDLFRIRISWDDDHSGTVTATEQLDMEVRP
jgi:type IV pilus assembly protein PilV